MPIISDGNNEIGDDVTDKHTTLGLMEHTGSYVISGTNGDILLINTSSLSTPLSISTAGHSSFITPTLGVFENSGLQPTIAILRGDNTTSAGGQFSLTRSTLTGAIGDGDVIGSLSAMGHDGTDVVLGGEIKFSIAGNVATDKMPTKIELMTNPGDGTTVFPNTRMTVDPNGNVGVGTSGQQDKLYVNGSVGIGSSDASDLNLKVTGSAVIEGNISGGYVTTIDNDHSSAGHVLKLLTDGNGSGTRILEMEDGDGDVVFRARADGRFGFGPDGVSSMGAGTFVVGIDNSSHTSDIAISQRLQHLGDSNTYMEFPSNDNISFTAGGNTQLQIDDDAIHVAQYIRHIGDTNTHINFTDDKIILKAGNLSMITMEEKSSAPHEVKINNGGNNIDFVIEDNSGNTYFTADASTSRIGIGTETPSYLLDVAGAAEISGSLSLIYGVTAEKSIGTVDLASPALTQNKRSAIIRATIDGNIANGTEGFSTIQINSDRITSSDTIMATSDTTGLFLFPSGVTNGRFFISLSNFTGGTITNNSTVQINWAAI